jgi:hypothetical protein
MDEFNDPMDAYQISNDGSLWTGYRQTQSVRADAAGNFILYSYPTREVGFKRTLIIESSGTPGFTWISPKFIVESPTQFVVCIPINFGASLSLPTYCSQDQVAKAIADKAAADAKAAADKAVADAKVIADAKAAADKAAADAKVIADAKAAADAKVIADAKAAADKAAADAKVIADAKAAADAKVIADAKAAADKAAANANRREQTINATPRWTGSVPLSSTGLPIKVISTSNLSVFSYNSTDNVCVFENGLIKTKTSGRCVIAFSQEGNSEFKPASNLILDFTIAAALRKTTITCVKGKLIKKVTAVKPKCPAGYKVKK